MPDTGGTPDLGRFLQTDPIRFGIHTQSRDLTSLGIGIREHSLTMEDINLYRYVKNNPINWTDFNGLKCGGGCGVAGGGDYRACAVCCAKSCCGNLVDIQACTRSQCYVIIASN